jgi:hypothetical protein
MASKFGVSLLFVFAAFSGLLMSAAVTPAFAYDDPDRTANRTVLGYDLLPDWLTAKPDHYEFSPLVSNSDPLTQHPGQWDGQDWDPSKWNKQWTPQIVLQKFFKARIFVKQTASKTGAPVVEVGPTFYKLSDLDQRRSLKLLMDQTGILKRFRAVQLNDWYTHDPVGLYTAKGMFLN